MSPSPSPAPRWLPFAAGIAAGLCGLGLFGLAHAALIVPIWSRLAGGLPFVLASGAAMGWAFDELLRARDRRASLLRGLAFGAWLWLALVPMHALDFALRASGRHETSGAAEAILDALLAFAAGALTGRALGRAW
ncbi:MAG TPA: hypothetical protein VJS92_09390, partial [Candidatus Polarisedimenticolaceae bacterium]|nr:hypothetical protein [Candidatus Polarisedimenticolaceae bacterium]